MRINNLIQLWQAARDGDVNTLSQLLPQATAEDLQYEGEVIIMFINLFIFYLFILV